MALNELEQALTDGAPVGGDLTTPEPMNESIEIDLDLDREKINSLKISNKSAQGIDPSRQAEILKLSQKTNLPSDFIERNYDTVKAKYDLDSQDYGGMVDKYPGSSRYYSNPENYKVSKEDLELAKRIEESFNKFGSYEPSKRNDFTSDLALAAEQGTLQLGNSYSILAASYGLVSEDMAVDAIVATAEKQNQLSQATPKYVTEFDEILTKESGDIEKAYRVFSSKIGNLREQKVIDTLKNLASEETGLLIGEVIDVLAVAASRPKAVAFMSTQSLANMIPSITGQVAGGVAGAKLGAAVAPALGPLAPAAPVVGAIGGAYAGSFSGSVGTEIGAWVNQRLSEEGYDLSNPAQVRAALRNKELMAEVRAEGERKGIYTAAVGAAFDAVAGRVFRVGAGASGLKKLSKGAGELAIQVAGEGASEAAGQVAAQGKVSMKDVLLESIAAGPGAAITIGANVATDAVQSARKKYSKSLPEAAGELAENVRVAVKSEQDIDALEAVGKAVSEMGATKEVPGKTKELISSIQEATGERDVFLQTDDFDGYFSSKGLSPLKAIEQIAGADAAKKYLQAKETGSPMQIPMADFIEGTANNQEIFNDLLPMVSVGQDGMNLKQIREAIEDVPQVLNALVQEANQAVTNEEQVADQQAAGVGKQIRDQLKEIGYTGQDAKYNAQIFEERLKARSEIRGVTPDQLMAERGLIVRKGEGEAKGQFLEQGITSQIDFKKTADDVLSGKVKSLGGYGGSEAAIFDVNENYVAKVSKKNKSSLTKRFFKEAILFDAGLAPESFLIKGKDGTPVLIQEKARPLQQIIDENVDSKSQHAIDSFVNEYFGNQIESLKTSIESAGLADFDITTNYGNIGLDKSGRLVVIDAGSSEFLDTRGGEYSVDNFKNLEKSLLERIDLTKKHIKDIESRKDFNSLSFGGQKKDPEVLRAEAINFAMIGLDNLNKKLSDIRQKMSSKAQVKITDSLLTNEEMRSASRRIFYQDSRGRILFGGDSADVIEILSKADPSTFIHELGHRFRLEVADDLKAISNLETKTDKQKQFIADTQAILDWVGAKSFDEMTVEQEEKFARGFEKYLGEGKAPSSALKKAFARFRNWMLAVYKQLVNLNVDLTDDVRAVFGRMLAADEAIKDANQALNYESIFDSARDVLPDEFAARYESAMEAHAELAREEMTEQMVKDWRKTQTAIYKEEKAKIRAEVETEVSNMQVYKAINTIKNEKSVNGSPMKINLSEIKGMLNVKNLKDHPYLRGLTSKDGMHPELLAEFLNYENADSMIKALSEAAPIEDVIDQRTEALMQERFPDMLDSTEIEGAAIEHAHNEIRSDILRMELDQLLKMDKTLTKEVIRRMIARLPSKSAIKEQAELIIGDKKLSESKPYIFMRAERRYAKEAGQLVAQGDFIGAFEAKRKEYLNHELYKSALRFEKVREKAERGFKKFFKSDKELSKTRDINLINAARAVLADFGLAQKDKNAESYLGQLKAYDPEGYDYLAGLIEAAREYSAKDLNDLTVSELEQMINTVDSLWEMSKTRMQIVRNGERMSVQDARETLLEKASVYAKKEKQSKYNQTKSKWEKIKSQFLSLKSELVRIEHWVDTMDEGNVDGPFRTLIWDPVDKALVEFNKIKLGYVDRFKELTSKLKDLTGNPILADELIGSDGKAFRFKDKAELLGALLHTGNQGNLKKLLVGRGWANLAEDGSVNTAKWDAFIKRMIDSGKLTKEDFDYVQSIWDMMEEIKPMAQRSHKRMFGHFFKEIEVQPIETPFGTYRGGYMPATIDRDEVLAIGSKSQVEALVDGRMQDSVTAGDTGFTKSRVNNFNAPLIMDLNLFGRHLDTVLRFSILKPEVVDVAKLVMNEDFKQGFKSIDDNAVDGIIAPFLDRANRNSAVAKMKSSQGKFALRVIRMLKSRASSAIMFANPVNVIQQWSGLPTAFLKVKPKHILAASKDLVTRPRELANEIASKSEYMNQRLSNQLFDIAFKTDQLLDPPTRYGKMQQWSQKNVYIFQQLAQNPIDIAVWLGGYNQAIQEGKTEESAIRFADSAVRLTQTGNRSIDVANVESHPWFHAFYIFYGYFNNLYNLNIGEFKKIVHSDMGLSQKARGALYVYTFGFMLNAYLNELLMSAAGGGLDDDDDGEVADDLISTFFTSQTKMATAMIPVVGQPLQAGLNYANNKPYDDKTQASPAVTAVTSVAGAPISVYKAVSEGKGGKKAIRDSFTAMTILTGLPFGALSRPAAYLYDVSEGNANPSGPFDFTRGVLTGKSGK